MLHETLKQATKHQHDQLEQLMFVGQIMDGSLTFDEYKKILTTNYLTHARAEELLYGSLSAQVQQQLDIKNRVKLPALLHDLEEAKITIPAIQPEADFLDLDSDAAILGSMYVMEGATLGGNVIVKRLKANPHLAPYNLNFHYYQVYGDKLIEKWKQFVAMLNTIREADYAAATNSANAMFDHIASLQAWPA